LNALDFKDMVRIIKATYSNKFTGGFMQNVALYDHAASIGLRGKICLILRAIFYILELI